jgi:hypothetical protein
VILTNSYNYNDGNFLSSALINKLSNSCAGFFKYQFFYYNLYNKIMLGQMIEFFNKNIFNLSLCQQPAYSFDKWLTSTDKKFNNQLNDFVDPFKEYIEI